MAASAGVATVVANAVVAVVEAVIGAAVTTEEVAAAHNARVPMIELQP